MPFTVSDVMRVMEDWAPEAWAYEWDRVGLHLGEPRMSVTKVLCCLSVTPEAFAAAKKAKADMIVAHHPLIWAPIKALRTDHAQTRLCLDMAAAGMACFAAHTNLDIAPGGVNSVLADAIGLQETEPLFPAPQVRYVKLVSFVPESHLAQVREAVSAAGAGVIGDYSQCSFSSPGIGTFVPGASTDPYSGKKGELAQEEERRFETLCPKARMPAVLRALRAAHPYEEPACDVVPLDGPTSEIGLGLRGELSESTSVAAFAQHVKKALEVDHVRIIGDVKKKVRRAAVLGGRAAA